MNSIDLGGKSVRRLAPAFPVVVPIPGTSSVAHREENLSADGVQLTDEEIRGIGQGRLTRRRPGK